MILALKALTVLVMSFLLMALILFLAAGTLLWPAGWIYLILLFGWLLVGIVLLLKYNPGLLEERLSLSQPNQKAWDRIFLLLFELFLFAWLVLMALDAVRFHWSQMPLALQVVGAIALVASFILISLTFRENAFLSPTVRIQQERGQTVISTGPYHYVRHPMYAGGLLLICYYFFRPFRPRVRRDDPCWICTARESLSTPHGSTAKERSCFPWQPSWVNR